MKKSILNNLVLAVFVFTLTAIASCRDRRHSDDGIRNNQPVDQERDYFDEDPMNQRDQSRGRPTETPNLDENRIPQEHPDTIRNRTTG